MKQRILGTVLNNKPFLFLEENDNIAEIYPFIEDRMEYAVGDIYIGKVKKIVPNIHAAFIEISPGLECYCPVSDAQSAVFTQKNGKKPLCVGDELIVQVKKEASKTKPPAVTGNLSETGKYLVLTVSDKTDGIYGKIEKARREEIKQWLSEYGEIPFGIIVRTEAASLTKDRFYSEIDLHVQRMQGLIQKAKTRTCFSFLKKAGFGKAAVFSHIHTDQLEQILIENTELYEKIRIYVRENLPDAEKKLTRYEDRMLPLHKLYGLERELEKALCEKVWMKSGAYLIIQQTEALTVIDVNTGKAISGKKENFLKINIEAAKEAATQMRLRNLSGIILIDFINLGEKGQEAELLKIIRQETSKDPINTEVVDITKLGLVEITRQKERKPLEEAIRKM